MRPMHDEAEEEAKKNRRPIMQYGFRDKRADIFYDTIKFAKVVTGFNITKLQRCVRLLLVLLLFNFCFL